LNIAHEQKSLLRDYLLGRLDDTEEETVKLRLRSDADYSEELDIVTHELIDEYATGRVASYEVDQVERFISELPERGKKLRFALALKKRAQARRDQQRRTRNLLRVYLPIAASLLIASSFVAWHALFFTSDVDKGLVALRTAYGAQRPVDARITGFNYAPTLRGENRVNSVQRDLAAALLIAAATQHPDAQSKQALGQYYITQRRFEEAVVQLEESLKFDEKNAKAHSDLGVALLELGKQKAGAGESLKDFARSHEHLKKAIELDSSLPEARYNLALVLEQMGLAPAAVEAWRKYLEQDSTSQWANEARQHLNVLEQRRPSASTQNGSFPLDDFLDAYRARDDEKAWRILSQNREVVTRKFIPIVLVDAYLDHALARRTSQAESMLQALGYAGELESRKAGDQYTTSLARFYRSHSQAHLGILAKANDLAGEGYDLCGRTGYSDAVKRFEQAQRIFISVGNEAESGFVGYWLAWSSFYDKRRVAGESYAEDVIRYCRERNYKWLLAQALGLLSNIKTGSNDQSAVLDLSRQALLLSEEVNDTYGTQKYLASLAGKYSAVYNFSESLNLLARCLRLADDFWPGDRQAWRNYDTATQVFNRMGQYSASAAYGEEALRLIHNGLKDPYLIYLSQVHLGMAYGRLNNPVDGIRHAEAGLAIGRSIPGNTGKEITAYSAFQLGELHRQRGALEEAARRYEEAINLYDQLSFNPFKFVAHRGLFLTYLAQGNDSGAEAELQVVLDIFDAYRERIKEEDNRNYFFDVAQEVYDAAIDFAHSRIRDDEAAFQHSESSRARSLLVTLLTASSSGASPKAYTLAEIRQRVPQEVQIVQYAVLGDKLLIWLIWRDGFWVNEKLISREALTEQVHKFLDLVTRPSSNQEDLRRISMALYDTLIAPVKAKLLVGKTLCIVPDKVLNHLPFVALLSSDSGRYLIQDHALVFSPSSSVFIVNTQVASNKPAAVNEKLLSVGNPTFDRSAFPSLSDLPSAATEAETIAQFYNPPGAMVLTGKQAHKEQVIRGMESSDILHFASHYVVDEHSPMGSQLLLAADARGDKSDGSLSASDIYNMKLARPRVAILSACSTGVERYYNGEGMIGMARTFLGAGVPEVVASQWPVDSAPTTGLMIKLHEYRCRYGLSTIEALRAAQLEYLNNSSQSFRHPYYWAPFVTIGGYAGF
jgi:CHAT domain-containing protein/cytochrome c-type biogenesis protein CcmH/NrfG